MKGTFKKISFKGIALILIVVFAASFMTACAPKSIVGKWRASFNIYTFVGDKMSSLKEIMTEEDIQKFFKDVDFDLIFTFNDDSTVSVNIDPDSVTAAEEAFKANAKVVFPPYLAQEVSVPESELDSYLEKSGMSLDQVIDALTESMDFQSLVSAAEISGYYVYENNCIYFLNSADDTSRSNYLITEFKGGKLIITGGSDGNTVSEQYENLLPLELTKEN